jgi:hypothetical protein
LGIATVTNVPRNLYNHVPNRGFVFLYLEVLQFQLLGLVMLELLVAESERMMLLECDRSNKLCDTSAIVIRCVGRSTFSFCHTF